MKVLVVDDSPSMVNLVSKLVGDAGGKVIGSASNGEEALQKATELKPDVITLDIEMPGVSGLQVLPRLLKACDASVLMCSSLTSQAASATIQALEKGAFDYIPKLELGKTFTTEMLRERLNNALMYKAFRKKCGDMSLRSKSTTSQINYTQAKCLLIGVSTGGPPALTRLFAGLAPLPVPTVIVQHMPEAFVASLAQRLAEQTHHKVSLAEHGKALIPGEVYFAPGNRHVWIRKNGQKIVTELSDEPSGLPHKPSVDVLFQTAGEALGRDALGLILTGMGKDGCEGAKTMRARGGVVIAESAQSCVVYGMPRAVIEAQVAQFEFSLAELPEALSKALGGKLATQGAA